MRKMTNRMGAKLSPCFTPQVDLNTDSTCSIVRLIVVLLYSFFNTWITLFGIPHFASICHKSSLFTVSYAFTKSTDMT